MDSRGLDRVIEAAGLSVRLDREFRVASLRYADSAGGFAASAALVFGRPLPAPLQAAAVPGTNGRGEFILAWRSPSETLLLSADRTAFAQCQTGLANTADGCTVDQTGGIWVVRMAGARVGDLLLRLGSSASIPSVGEARTSRLADLSVPALCVRADETLLLIERVYADHLLPWIRAAAADF